MMKKIKIIFMEIIILSMFFGYHFKNINAAETEGLIPGKEIYNAQKLLSEQSLYEKITGDYQTPYRLTYSKFQESYDGLAQTQAFLTNENFRLHPEYFYQLILTDLLQSKNSFIIEQDKTTENLITIASRLGDFAVSLAGDSGVQEELASVVGTDFLQNCIVYMRMQIPLKTI